MREYGFSLSENPYSRIFHAVSVSIAEFKQVNFTGKGLNSYYHLLRKSGTISVS